MMTVRKVTMGPEEARELVQIATKCDFDIDISYNRYIVDAKSFLGVYGLDLRRALKVSYNGYNSDFEELLQRLATAS